LPYRLGGILGQLLGFGVGWFACADQRTDAARWRR
jgi:hypothetical protein